MARQKKLMLLGGAAHIIPVIDAAHNYGYYVITCDYLPDNIAHKYSDEYVNVSIIDREAVLKEARLRNIDGITSFGIDPGVTTAAYVQEKMGLPSMGPYESVCILQNKDLFRAFMAENGFNVPKSKGFSSKVEALKDLSWYDFPMIVKPADGSGSKGVTRVDDEQELMKALDIAFDRSRCGNIIIESFIEKQGCSSDCDAFSVNGELKAIYFSAQHFDHNSSNPYTPSAFSWPSTFTSEQAEYLTSEIQRMLTLLNMGTTVYNIETRIGQDGKPYIMEVTPRGGGNRLSEMVRYMTGEDFIEANVLGSLGEEVKISQTPIKDYWAEVILHSNQEGFFAEIEIADGFPCDVIELSPIVKKGDFVHSFTCASDAIGTVIIRSKKQDDIIAAIYDQKKWLKVIVK